MSRVHLAAHVKRINRRCCDLPSNTRRASAILDALAARLATAHANNAWPANALGAKALGLGCCALHALSYCVAHRLPRFRCGCCGPLRFSTIASTRPFTSGCSSSVISRSNADSSPGNGESLSFRISTIIRSTLMRLRSPCSFGDSLTAAPSCAASRYQPRSTYQPRGCGQQRARRTAT